MRCVLCVLLIAITTLAAAQTPSGSQDPMSSLSDDTIVAIVDGEAIRMADVEDYSRSKDPKKLFQLNQQLFEFRQNMLALMLGERLLTLEADKAGMTVDELLDKHLKIEPVTPGEIQEVLSRQPPGSVDVALVTPLIRQFLEERKRGEARSRYIAALVARAKKGPKPLVIRLQPPRQAIPVLPSDPTQGTGTVEVVEFSDFECPFCAKVQPVLKEALARFEGQVRHVWKDYPLPIHPRAVPAAVAARCAGEQGMFWKYHDLLFAHQQALSDRDLEAHARTLNLEAGAFARCLQSKDQRRAVDASLKIANANYPVPATPTVFINGRIITGVAPLEAYTRIISEELGH